MAKKRVKKRTHIKKVENPNDPKTPKSFVIRTGKTMSDPTSSVLAQLVLDVRRIMEPNTATRLRVLPLQKLMMELIAVGTTWKQTQRLPHYGWAVGSHSSFTVFSNRDWSESKNCQNPSWSYPSFQDPLLFSLKGCEELSESSQRVCKRLFESSSGTSYLNSGLMVACLEWL